MTTLEFIKSETLKKQQIIYAVYDVEVVSVDYGINIEMFWDKKGTLEIRFEGGSVTLSDGETEKGLGIQFTCAYKTPKGYISSKKIPVVVNDQWNVTLEEAAELLKFNTDAVKNTFDPFYHENQAKGREAAAMNYIAQNYISKEDTF